MKGIKLLLKHNALSISIGSFALALVGSAWSLIGNFDNRVSYCDTITKPCTRVVVPGWYGTSATATETITIKGNGITRTLVGVGGIVGAGAAFISSAVAANNQREIDDEANRSQEIEGARQQILEGEELQKFEIASEFRVKDFKREMQDGYAYLMLEENPELFEQMVLKQAPQAVDNQEAAETPVDVENSEESTPPPEPEKPTLLGAELPEPPELEVEFWDWNWLRSRAEELPHIRIVAPTNGGKTTLTNWMIDVVPCDRSFIITVKRKPHQWKGLEVIGVPEDYPRIRQELYALQDERVRRTQLMADGQDFPMWNVGVDEWKAINRNIKAIKADPENGIDYQPSAKEVMGDTITLARESKIRIFALAQGRQVGTWGLEGESDLEECFASFYLGQFAVEEAIAYRNKQATNSPDWITHNKVVTYLESLGKRAVWVACEFGKFPGIVPDLSTWQRQGTEPIQNEPDTETPAVTDAEIVTNTATAVDEDDGDDDLWPRAIAHLNRCNEIPDSPQDTKTQDKPATVTHYNQTDDETVKPLSDKQSGGSVFVWSVKTVSEFYPETTPSALYQQLKLSSTDCPKARDLIRKVLKCSQGKAHPTRSYTIHGKTLFVWLIDNYDDRTLRPKYSKDIEAFEKEFKNEQ